MSTDKRDNSSGAPKWVAIIGAIVAVSGTVYVWFAHFYPRGDPAKAPSPPSVSVSGPGSVGVGNMSGGTINVGSGTPIPGSTAPAPSSPAR